MRWISCAGSSAPAPCGPVSTERQAPECAARITLENVLTVGVLALQGDVREHTHALETAGAQAVPVRRGDELAKVDGLVLPGGESTTIVKLAKIFDLYEPLRERIAAGLPVYGSCAGMILLADRVDAGGSPLEATFGGIDISVRRNAFGRQVDSFEEDVVVEGISGGPIHAVFIRAPWVQEVGPKAEALGRVNPGTVDEHVVVVRQQNLLATSFHPELTGDLRIHQLFVEMVRAA
jgi:pyridoxal 5'-phosphate synthase pdxT subunit